jgi:sterol desaturase/sphingolipid hydroxylase (fatty acid hydroxylase superfamily)
MTFVSSALSVSFWPVSSVAALALTQPRAEKAAFPVPSPFASLSEHVLMQLGCLPRLLFVYLVYVNYGDWRSFGQTLSWSWVLPILLRDVSLCLFVGCVDSFLLLSDYSPFKAAMATRKYNSVYPNLASRNGTSSLVREAAWCCVSACIAGLLEAGVVHAYATGRFAAARGSEFDAWWTDARTVFFMLSWFYTQNVQFYTMHRLLHKWGTTSVPDIGAFLFKHVHSLHHESRNPTAFSGISMHPVESALYFSYALLPCFFGAHVFAFLYIKCNLIAAAMIGHSAFAEPGTGSMPHFLHHSLVQVNYAESHVPLDYWLGTWAATEAEAAASIKRRMKKSVE